MTHLSFKYLLKFQYIAVLALSAANEYCAGIHKIKHFSCGRDFYVIRNHMYKIFVEQFNIS